MFTQLQELYLNSNDLQDEGAAILAEFLKAPVVLCHRVYPLKEGAVFRRGWRQEQGMHACTQDFDRASWRLTRLTSRTRMHLRYVRSMFVSHTWVLNSNHNVSDVGEYSSLLWKTLAHRTSQCGLSAFASACTVYFWFHKKNGGWKWRVHAFSKKSDVHRSSYSARSMVLQFIAAWFGINNCALQFIAAWFRIAAVISVIVLHGARQQRKLCSKFTSF